MKILIQYFIKETLNRKSYAVYMYMAWNHTDAEPHFQIAIIQQQHITALSFSQQQLLPSATRAQIKWALPMKMIVAITSNQKGQDKRHVGCGDSQRCHLSQHHSSCRANYNNYARVVTAVVKQGLLHPSKQLCLFALQGCLEDIPRNCFFRVGFVESLELLFQCARCSMF